jgi:4-hydroxy-3-polyprenylbenzoate decarboxylase
LGPAIDEVKALPDKLYGFRDVGAAVSSGSFHTAGMLVAPCSIKTLSGIANSYDEHLIVRAADVCLKERRPLVLMVRETPLDASHISLMAAATRNGAIIMPPLPAFYTRPTTIDDIVDQTVGRALDLLQIETPVVRRWRCETDRGEA